MKREEPTQDPEHLRRMYYAQRRTFAKVVRYVGEVIASGFIADIRMEIRTNDCESWTLEISTPHNPPLFPNADDTNYKTVSQIIDSI